MDEKVLSQLNTLLDNTTDAVRSVVLDGHLDEEVIVLMNTYNLSIDESVSLKNTILLTLLGVIPTTDVKKDLAKDLKLDEASLKKLIKDVDTGIFEKARIKLFGEEYEEGQEVKKLSLGKEESDDALREQIMANTDRDSAIKTSPLDALKKKKEEKKGVDKNEEAIVPLVDLVKSGPTKEPTPPTKEELQAKLAEEEAKKKDTSPVLPGSRSELLEKLNVLQSIPNTEQVSERVASIRAQIAHSEEELAEEERKADIEYARISLKSENADKNIYPTSYSIDPYRETAD